MALSGTDLRGPAPNTKTTPSVRPSKWQLAQFCQPSLDSRSSVETVVPSGRSKWPRDEKNISAPTWTTSSSALGGSLVGITSTTSSVVRSTTETLRETKLAT